LLLAETGARGENTSGEAEEPMGERAWVASC
jgi:hypothetical protein